MYVYSSSRLFEGSNYCSIGCSDAAIKPCVFSLPLYVSSCLLLRLLLPTQRVFYPPLLALIERIIDVIDLELLVLVAFYTVTGLSG